MSNDTKIVAAKPYHNLEAEADIAAMEAGEQNPTDSKDQDPSSTSDTPDAGSSATSVEDDSVYAKRYRDLKKYHDDEIYKARQRIRDLEKDGQAAFTPPKTDDELNQFKEQYPDFFDAMLTVSQNRASELTSTISEELDDLKAQLTNAKADKALKEIEASHPDYTSIVSSPEFMAWLEIQDPTIQSWINDNTTDSRTFINALDLYKVQAGVTKTKTRSDKGKPRGKKAGTAADAVVTNKIATNIGDTTDRIWTVDEIQKMPIDVFEQYMDEISQAQREGRVQ